jgi:hypothetical protein
VHRSRGAANGLQCQHFWFFEEPFYLSSLLVETAQNRCPRVSEQSYLRGAPPRGASTSDDWPL